MRAAAPPTAARTAIVAAALAGLSLAVFAQVGAHPFIDLDDAEYVARNRFVARGFSWEGVAWAFTSFRATNWHPLTWISHMIDVQLFGLKAGRHHLVNVGIHIGNAILLLLALRRLTGAFWRSALVAALFAVHPLHVESVAWVAERKDVLSALFWIATLAAYGRYVGGPSAISYLLVVTPFALGLLCKPMLVTLPFALLLLDWWPLGRLRPTPGRPAPARMVLAEKVPLLLLAAASSVVTYAAQTSGGATASFELYPLAVRAANAPVALLRYLAKTAWPAGLSIYYPHPGASLSPLLVAAALSLAVAASAAALRLRSSRPHLLTGWFWFIGTLVPVIGIVQVGMQSMADRYTYLPLVGIFVLLAWSLPRPAGTRWARLLGAALLGAALCALAATAWLQTRLWRSNADLFSHALAVTSGNWLAHESIGIELYSRGDVPGALRQIEEALRIRPRYPLAHYNLGVILQGLGRNGEAESHYREALRLRPGYEEAHVNLAALLRRRGDAAEAAKHLREALALDPGDPYAHNSLGELLLDAGERADAITHFREALRLRPGFAGAAENLRRALPPEPGVPAPR